MALAPQHTATMSKLDSSSSTMTRAQETEAQARVQGVDLHSLGQVLAYDLIHNSLFEYSMGAIILLNMVVIIVETDEAVIDDEASAWTSSAGSVILIIFVLELVLRLFALRMAFWRDNWNRFDFGVVATDLTFTIVGLVFGSIFPTSTLRVFRLAKLARVSKVLRVFPELRQLMAGLIGSMMAVFWGMLLLTFVLLVWSILAVQFIHPLSKEAAEQGYYVGCERCPRAYSSVMHSFLTFSQSVVAGDSWGSTTIPLIEYSPATSLFFGGVFLTVGMAVVNLILGIVVTKAQEAHEEVKAEENATKKLTKKAKLNYKQDNLLRMCRDMDSDNSGDLTREELEEGYRDNEEFRSTLSDMDIEEDGLSLVWTILDVHKRGTVKYQEFVGQIYKMQESETGFMLAYIRYYLTLIKDQILSNTHEDYDQLHGDLLRHTFMLQPSAEEGLPLAALDTEATSSDPLLMNRDLNGKLQTKDGSPSVTSKMTKVKPANGVVQRDKDTEEAAVGYCSRRSEGDGAAAVAAIVAAPSEADAAPKAKLKTKAKPRALKGKKPEGDGKELPAATRIGSTGDQLGEARSSLARSSTSLKATRQQDSL